MSKEKVNWNYLNRLGSEYHGLVQEGHGVEGEIKHPRQREIESEIFSRITPWIYKIAYKMVKGTGWKVSTPYGPRFLSLKGYSGPLEDLIQEGGVELLKALPEYDSQKSSLSTYGSHRIAAAIRRKGAEEMGLFRLPQLVYNKARSITAMTRKNEGEKYALIKKLEEITEERPMDVPVSLMANAVYHGIHRTWIDITTSDQHGAMGDYRSKFRSGDLADQSDAVQIEELVADKQLQLKALELLKSLTPLEQDLLRQRFFEDRTLKEIGEQRQVSRERIRQLETQALAKLRRKFAQLDFE